MHRSLIPLFALLCLLLTACGGSAAAPAYNAVDSSSSPSSSAGASYEAAPAATAAPAAAPQQAGASAPTDSQVKYDTNQQQQQQRLVIRNAQLSLIVEDVAATERTIRFQVESLGGFLVQSTITNGVDEYAKSRAEIQLRIPATEFDNFINFVLDDAVEVLQNQVSGSDVTDAYVDLQSRLRSLEVTYNRVIKFLDEAETVEQALEVNRQITEIQNEIEQVKGRMEFYKQSAALSSISIQLQDDPAPASAPIVPKEGWQPGEVARESLGGLVAFGQGLINLLIRLLIWSPVWALLIGGVYWMYRWYKKSEDTKNA